MLNVNFCENFSDNSFIPAYNVSFGMKNITYLDIVCGCQALTYTILLEDMGQRIDELEKNIADLMDQSGFEEK